MVRVHPDPPPTSSDGRIHQVRAGLPPATQQDGAFRRLTPRRPGGSQARGCSSAGRAPALQAGGHRFDPGQLHQFLLDLPVFHRDTASAHRLIYVCTGGLTVAVQSPSCSLKIRESCWRLGFASGLAAGCISNVCQSFAENQSANESCCAYGLRLFEVIWSSEQAHTVDA
jgi:hypothetical protein